MQKWGIYGIASLTLVILALVYWPVVHFNFVWDDWQSFHDTPWLRQGDEWKHYIFRDFNEWTVYFRPLVIAFLALQVHVFHDAPGPMHAVSLTLHLLNTLLVGSLAWRCSKSVRNTESPRIGSTVFSMLIYGLHPALIEPIAWIGCQFDLIATMFILLGLLFNATIRSDVVRAPVIGLLFFLAACSKESALPFPFLVVIFDWATLPKEHPFNPISTARSLIRRHWKTYCGLAVAGLLYIWFRNWALGGELAPPYAIHTTTVLQWAQEVCAVYLHYWRTFFWPMPEMGPIHLINTHSFAVISASSVAIDAASISVVAVALYVTVKRGSSTGAIVLAASIALLPVLHLYPATLDSSLYHERYAMTAVAIICAMLPLVLIKIPMTKKLARYAFATVAACWLLVSFIDIRVTLPNWSSDTSLWRWALAMYPYSSDANINLMAAYEKNHDETNLETLEDSNLVNLPSCATCMLTVANIAADHEDTRRAVLALTNALQSKQTTTSPSLLHLYYLVQGKLLILQGRRADAERTLEISASLAPEDPRPRLVLAHDLAYEGKSEAALQVGASAIRRLPPDQQAAATQALNEVIEMGRKGNTPSPDQNSTQLSGH